MTALPSPAVLDLDKARLTRAAARKPAIDIAAQWRAEVKARDWGKVHIDADRRAPISLARRVWRYTMPIGRRG